MVSASHALLLAIALSGATPPRSPSCSAPEHRQLDFAVGNWIVHDRSGNVVGTVTLSMEYGGCVLIEKWRGLGDAGEGLGVAGYLAGSKSWHRDFVDRDGFVLALDGRWDGSRMVMTGKDYRNADVTRMHRLTWTPKHDGAVEVLWWTSTDAGRSWQVHRDVLLRRIAE